ncbi:MAG: efflux RND transporter periplasmic adaptor subunit [Candidatus Marinimicrobia bacterium]|nr:efflux RND transporter periplasmic adaptor subunit [Candidatus Neomarinimicrobiota bacterium]MCF7839798.1 efflux RND transporter periplasmic adaptor subunit [Candidatus Neomarinimicrobiota bacterium]
MTKRQIIITALVLVGLIISAWYFNASEETQVENIEVTPSVGPFRVTVTTAGELQAKNSIDIQGPTNARRLRIYNMKILKLIPEGTEVDSGDFVAELDQSELRSKIEESQLAIDKAESQFEQAQLDCTLSLANARNDLVNLTYALEERRLYMEQSKFEAPSIIRQAEIDLDKAHRSLKQARENYVTKVRQSEAKMREVEAELSKRKNELRDLLELEQQFTIYAPEKGMVIYVREWDGTKITEGSQVSAWRPTVATLPDLSVMESVTYVNEVDIQKIKKGQPVEIGLDADPDKNLTGLVTSVANIGEQRPNSDSKVFEVRIEIDKADSTLRPAMTTSNTIIVAGVDSALYVPLECLHAQDSLSYVFRHNSGGWVKQQVEVGLINEDNAVIVSGIEPTDKLMLSVPANSDAMPFVPLPAN